MVHLTMDVVARVSELERRYEYGHGHNARYLELRRTVMGLGTRELLTLGCGKGQLEAILPPDVRCVGVDIDPEQVAIAREMNEGLDREFFVGDVFEFEPGRTFDCVLLSEVVEHVEDDVGLIQRAYGMAERHLIITVPNYQRLLNRWNSFFGLDKTFLAEDHLREYDLAGLHGIVRGLGYDVIAYGGIFFEVPYQQLLTRFATEMTVHGVMRPFQRLGPGLCRWLMVVVRKDRA